MPVPIYRRKYNEPVEAPTDTTGQTIVKGAQGLLGQYQQVAQKKRQLQDDAYVTKTASDYNINQDQEISQLKKEYQNDPEKGAAAIKESTLHNQNEILNKAPNGRVRRKLQKAFTQSNPSLFNSVSQWQDKISLNQTKTSIDRGTAQVASKAFENPGGFAASKMAINQMGQTVGDIQGVEAQKTYMMKANQELYKNTALGLIEQGRFKEAEEFMSTKDFTEMMGVKKLEVKRVLESKKNKKATEETLTKGQGIADDIFAEFGTNQKEGLEKIRKKYEGDTERYAVAQYKMRVAETQSQEKAEQDTAYNNALEVMSSGGSLEQIKPFFKDMSGVQQASVLKALQQKTKEGAVKTEPDLYLELIRNLDNPDKFKELYEANVANMSTTDRRNFKEDYKNAITGQAKATKWSKDMFKSVVESLGVIPGKSEEKSEEYKKFIAHGYSIMQNYAQNKAVKFIDIATMKRLLADPVKNYKEYYNKTFRSLADYSPKKTGAMSQEHFNNFKARFKRDTGQTYNHNNAEHREAYTKEFLEFQVWLRGKAR